MPVILNWLLRLLPTNPICLRLVSGGSRRWRHLVIRGAYLALMITVTLFILLASVGGASLSLRGLAASGASIFQVTAYVQVIVICLLTPIFMAGAIVHEASPRTWDIMLTTPLNSLQIVIGNLFGRLFFVLALLLSSLPLFVLLQMFGGVPGRTIIASYVIAACSALLVASIAVMLSVTRTGGRRAVFVFYVVVVLYLVITFIGDNFLRIGVTTAAGAVANSTTWLTAINPFLAIEALLSPSTYIVPDTWNDSWWTRQWMGKPVSTFNWLCVICSLLLIIYSTLRVRVLGLKTGQSTWLQRLLRVSAASATTRPPRIVGHNPVAWRESHLRRTVSLLVARWGFLIVGLIVLFVILGIHASSAGTSRDFMTTQALLMGLLLAETIIVVLTAINLSATAVSREREDGFLDLILTTPIQPGPYLAGKHRGLILYLAPMIALPVVSMLLISGYVLIGGLGASVSIPTSMASNITVNVPLMFPAVGLAFAIVFVPFIAFCVMIGLHWSIRSRGTIGSIVAAVLILFAIIGLLGACGLTAANSVPYLGVCLTTMNPGNLILLLDDPARWLQSSWVNEDSTTTIQWLLIIGSVVSGSIYVAIAWAMHRSMTQTFMMTVRRLSGTS
ncbi:MAG: hypothetical protein VX527_01255 [Planctomycetota bacterium]|nr:hypothetical protein [Planctomycetota bacterium]